MPDIVMTPGEFSRALRLLPADVAERARSVRSAVLRHGDCPYCRIALRSLDLAVQAAVYDELDWARTLVAEAEHYAETGNHPPGHAAGHAALRPGPSQARGCVERWVGTRPVVAATDASWKKGHAGIGYITTAGHWGLRGRPTDRDDPTGPSKVLVHELRAVDLLLTAIGRAHDPILLVDSLGALRYLRIWQSGRTDVMPDGYDLRPRRNDGPPTLVRLAGRMAARPGICLEHVKSHSGHLLNEAADALASIARRRVTEAFDSRARAEDLAESFLLSWHEEARAA